MPYTFETGVEAWTADGGTIASIAVDPPATLYPGTRRSNVSGSQMLDWWIDDPTEKHPYKTAYAGTYSLKVVGGSSQGGLSPFVASYVGKAHQIQARVNSDTAALKCVVTEYNAVPTLQRTTTFNFTATINTWYFYNQGMRSGANTTQIKVGFYPQ